MNARLCVFFSLFTNLFFIQFSINVAAQSVNNLGDTCLTGNCTNGIGKMHYVNGNQYEGTFKNGLPNGKGTMI